MSDATRVAASVLAVTVRLLCLVWFILAPLSTAAENQPARAANRPPLNNLVVEADAPGVSRLRVEVTAADFNEPLRFELRATKGEFVGGIRIPPGAMRTVTISALDGNVEAYRGSAVIDIREKRSGPFRIVLTGRQSDDQMTVLIAPYRLVVERHEVIRDGMRTIRVKGTVLDGDGRPVRMPAKDISWGGFNLPFPGPNPCAGDPRFCYEIRVPVDLARAEIVLCLVDVVCKSSLPSSPPTPAFQTISAGKEHTCALHKSGKLFCWGANQYGQLGVTTTDLCPIGPPPLGSFACSKSPVQATINCPSGSACEFMAVDAGLYHTCAIDKGGHAWCWGQNDYGQLGSTNFSNHNPWQVSPPTVATEFPLRLDAISAGDYHTCALSSQGNLYCWGDNRYGQSGAPSTTTVALGLVSSLVTYRAVSAGHQHTCAINNSGAVECFGSDMGNAIRGDLFNAPDTFAPVNVQSTHPSLAGATLDLIAAGWGHTCVHVTGAQTICWGDGPTTDNTALTSPVASDLAVGTGYNQSGSSRACIIGTSQIYCGPVRGALAQFSVPGGSFAKIAVGERHTCVLDSAGKVLCMGENYLGQLGNGASSNTGTSTLTPVVGLPN